MGPRVIAQRVPLGADPGDLVGMPGRVHAAAEEGGRYLVSLENVQDLPGVPGQRAVVKGERDLGPVASAMAQAAARGGERGVLGPAGRYAALQVGLSAGLGTTTPVQFGQRGQLPLSRPGQVTGGNRAKYRAFRQNPRVGAVHIEARGHQPAVKYAVGALHHRAQRAANACEIGDHLVRTARAETDHGHDLAAAVIHYLDVVTVGAPRDSGIQH